MWKKNRAAGTWKARSAPEEQEGIRLYAASRKNALIPAPERMQAVNLKADYRTNPIGIQTAAPHLSWECSGGKRQSAFRIICRNPFRKVVWDSGKRYLGIPFTAYLGPPLKSRDRIYWQVRLWNEDDLPGRWSEEAGFELGLLFWTDWKA